MVVSLSFLGASSCKLSSTLGAAETPDEGSGPAWHISARGRAFSIGSSSPVAPLEEKAGYIRFQHDYWLDTTEVTQEEYQQLMGGNPTPPKHRMPRNPVVNLSWFDAILFCNARSVRDGLDTVYSYSAVRRDSSGSVQSMEGLISRLDRPGWRLPSEAEWEFAASGGKERVYPWGDAKDSTLAASWAWFQSNSGDKIHAVATLRSNEFHLHDMAGNVMEWVQDWKGPYPKDPVVDFAGPEGPSQVAEVPLKGGSFNYGMEHLRIASRSATYAAFRASRADYVGFRCARGGYLANLLDGTGQATALPPVSIPMGNLARSLGASSAKLVFLNRVDGRGTLSWIDFGESTPTARALPDRDPVFHPEISPDGRWVVWSTSMEGASQPSRIKARKLVVGDTDVVDLGPGVIPRWWVSGTDTLLIRASSGEDDLSDSWASGETRAARWSGTGRLEPVDRKWADGSFHDGRSGQFLYTGYRRLRQVDLRTGAVRTLFTSPSNGKPGEDTSQVCNVSSAPDGSGRVLFLDFGSGAGSKVVGRPYGIHEVAFLADSLGKIVSTFAAPIGRRQWEHLEWSNEPRWATAIAQDMSGSNGEIRLLDLESGQSSVLASSEDLWMPKLWIEGNRLSPDDLEALDSAGLWNTPELGVTVEFSHKAVRFWKLHEQLRYLLLGSSRLRYGLDPESIHAGLALNWGLDGGEFFLAKAILDGYVLPHTPGLRGVVMSLEPGWWFQYRQQGWPGLAATEGFRFDANHDFWKGGIPKGYLKVVDSRKFPERNFDDLGGDIRPTTVWGWGTPNCQPPASEDMEAEPFLSNWNDLEASIHSIESRGIHLVLVNFPQNPKFRDNPGCMGRYGPSWSSWKRLQDRLRKLESEHPYFHFFDANQDGLHGYPSHYFQDQDHLADSGAIRLTASLDSMLEVFQRGR
ncbi:MAG TPA: SUMF1/EgtB/PvdO family nonheme iron enzyme [Fibrobacteria bacterium]|nr:SUMF1/EgtB/PvdO family nonheme iron enzyme [Fibrobacteria bacterium]